MKLDRRAMLAVGLTGGILAAETAAAQTPAPPSGPTQARHWFAPQRRGRVPLPSRGWIWRQVLHPVRSSSIFKVLRPVLISTIPPASAR